MNVEHTNIPDAVKTCIEELVSKLKLVLNNNLVGIYLHGSIPMNCFNSESSDIDILVLTKNSLTETQRTNLVSDYNSVKNNCPNKIELNVITSKVLNPFIHPTPCELYLTGGEDSVLTTKEDVGIASSIVVTKRYGVCLYGQEIERALPNVPRRYYLDSIARDSEWSYRNVMRGPDEGECSVPTYSVLNFCRVLAAIQNDLVLSKINGAEWGLENLPKEYKPIIKEALSEYIKKGSSKKVSCRNLKDFANYSNSEIRKSLETSLE
jgi:hypothetical protein